MIEDKKITNPQWAPGNCKWGFPIEAQYSWQLDFAESLRSVDVNILVDYEDDRPPAYAFSSPHLNHLSPLQAWGRAEALLTMLNGLLYLQAGLNFSPFSLRRCFDTDLDAAVHVNSSSAPVMEPFPDGHSNLRYSEVWGQGLSWHGKIFFVSRYDRHIRYLLQIFGREGITFVSLYKAHDTMRNAGFSERQLAALNKKDTKDIEKTEKDIGDFRFNANKFQGAGLDARHGLSDPVKTKAQIMSIDDASKVMCPIILSFILYRTKTQFDSLWKAVLYIPGSPPPLPYFPAYTDSK